MTNLQDINIGICGLGFVGTAMKQSFEKNGYMVSKNLFVYDKYKNNGSFNDLLKSDILFLALPTVYSEKKKSYDYDPLEETLNNLSNNKYNGVVVLKSTVYPGTLDTMYNKYKLNLVHNPEFLTARTAFHDFHNQFLIVLGHHKHCSQDKLELVKEFYEKGYPKAEIIVCKSVESESMKLYANCFYATKIQFFNEIYLSCQKTGANYDTVKNLMLKYGWINPQHTDVPGHDGKLSYGGGCFPKETAALLAFMEKNDIPHEVLQAVVNERNDMRNSSIKN